MKLAERWAQMRRMQQMGLMGSTPLLPQAGGFLQQQAFLIDAFHLFDSWLGELRKGRGDA